MKFSELKVLCKANFGIDRLADIARELDVSPQVVSNWKSRNQVPYKYVKIINNLIETQNSIKSNDIKQIPSNVLTIQPEFPTQEDYNIKEIIRDFYKKVVRHYKFILSFCFILTLAINIYYRFFEDRIYVSKSIIFGVSNLGQDNSTGLAGIAQQFGIGRSIQNSGALSSTAYYPDILKSKALMSNLVDEKIMINKNTKKLLISVILKKEKDTWSEVERKVAASRLLRILNVKKSKINGLLTVSASTNNPYLSESLLKLYLVEFEKFIRKMRISSNKEKLRYIQNRLTDVSKELIDTEESLKNFREKNRQINDSPGLIMIEERLVRDVDLKTSIYINLKNQFEITKIDINQKSKAYEILDSPFRPLGPTYPKLKRVFWTSIFLSLTLSIMIIYGNDWLRSNKEMFS